MKGKIFAVLLALLSFVVPAGAQTVQHTHCTQANSCTLPNPKTSGNAVIAVASFPMGASTEIDDGNPSDVFVGIYVPGYYDAGSPGMLWYSLGVSAGPLTVHTASQFADMYLAEYPPLKFDMMGGSTTDCCGVKSLPAITTTGSSDLLIVPLVVSYPGGKPATFPANAGLVVEDTGSLITVEDAVVGPGTYSPAFPSPAVWGGEAIAFTLLEPWLSTYKAPYNPLQVQVVAPNVATQFANPTKQHNMLVVVASQSTAISDTQGNTWKLAFQVPFTGIEFWYALDIVGGPDSITTNGSSAIAGEYPPSLGPDGANYGTYAGQNVDGPQGGSDDVGWTLPIQTTHSCDLLIVAGLNNTSSNVNSPWKPSPVSYFTVRAGTRGILGLEDGTSGIPGLYFGTFDFTNVYSHWLLGMVAFDMNGCK